MSVRLSERDLRILAKCAVSKWLTTGQLQRLYFPDVTADAVRKSLRRLQEAGYLVSHREHRMAEALHSVGPKGKPMLEAKGLTVELARTPPRQVEHMIAINDVRVAVETDPVRLYFFAHWELAKLGWPYPVIPDAIFALNAPKRLTFVIECDRATETLDELSRKFLAYAEGLSGFPFNAVILVTETPGRLKTVRQHVRRRFISLHLLGTALRDIKDNGICTIKLQDLGASDAVTVQLTELGEQGK